MKQALLIHTRQLKPLLALLAAIYVSTTVQAQPAQFATPEEAVTALVETLEKNDNTALQQLLGPGSEEIVSSGDAVADRNGRQQFVQWYRTRHQLKPDGEGSMLLEVGEEGWPFPVPVVQRDGKWILDGAAGAEELLYRRIGRNELGAIAVCNGFLDAQSEYASQGHDGLEPGLYASKLLSTPGRHDGLYWQAAEGETPSPAGDAIAAAAGEGYRAVQGQRTPYHGYYFRMLYAQGSHAPGGAYDYFVDGQLTQGIALLAWPANYGNSGIKTFMVSHDGVIHEKDLGETTALEAEKFVLFDPDPSWSPVQMDEDTNPISHKD